MAAHDVAHVPGRDAELGWSHSCTLGRGLAYERTIMVTKLSHPLKREVTIDKEPWVVTLTPQGLKLTRKGRRKGIELEWKAMSSGDAALAVALNASLRPRKSRATAR